MTLAAHAAPTQAFGRLFGTYEPRRLLGRVYDYPLAALARHTRKGACSCSHERAPPARAASIIGSVCCFVLVPFFFFSADSDFLVAAAVWRNTRAPVAAGEAPGPAGAARGHRAAARRA